MATLNVTGLVLNLAGYPVKFQAERKDPVLDEVTLTIETPERTVTVAMSEGQYDAIRAAMHDIGDECIKGEWFGNSE